MEGQDISSFCLDVIGGEVSEILIDEEGVDNPVAHDRKDFFKKTSCTGNMSAQDSESNSTVTQPIFSSAATVEGKQLQTSDEARHVSLATSDVMPGKEPSPLTSTNTSSGSDEIQGTENLTVSSATGIGVSTVQTATDCRNGASKPPDMSGDSVAAQTEDVGGGPLPLSHALNDRDVDASLQERPEKSFGRESPPLLQIESPPPLIAEARAVKSKQSVATTHKKAGTSGVTRPTQAPPVLQPEVITIDDNESVCDFEEPPLLLPEVAVTRKRKGIVRKRSFFGDTIDSSILKESILEGSPIKRAHKSGVASVTQSKSSAQTLYVSRPKDGGTTILLSRSGKSGNVLVGPKLKTPSKSSGESSLADPKKPEDPSARPRLLNRQPLEKKASRMLFPVEASENSKFEQKTTVIITRDKPLGRRMGSGRQPSRRSGAARCRTSSVRDQGRFAGTVSDKRITTGWRSVPPVPLGDISTHCGYADISGHNREVFAPVSPPSGELVALSRDSKLTERIQKVVGDDKLDSECVFMNTTLDGFLEEKAPLKLSFQVPHCYMPHEKHADEEPEYPPPAQPTPTIERPQGEPRFKTLLEKQVWLGVRDQKDLKAVRPASSPSKEASSSEALPLYSLLLPPRYLAPARSSRDLSVHRGRHFLPLCKVMHKSLDMRRAWDEPAKGADCVQFIYDRHHQVRIRGSGSMSDGPTTRAYGKLLRPEAVEVKLNAWIQKEYQVTTEAVSRQRALLAAASVQDPVPTLASGKASARRQDSRSPKCSSRSPQPSPLSVRHSSRTPRPRRRLLPEDYTCMKTCPDSAHQATGAVEDKRNSFCLQPEEWSAPKQGSSTADQEERSIGDRQDSFASQFAEVEQTAGPDVTEGTVSDEQDIVGADNASISHQSQNDASSKTGNPTKEEDHVVDSPAIEPNIVEDVLHQMEDGCMEEITGDSFKQKNVPDDEEQKGSRSENETVSSGEEDDVAAHQTYNRVDRNESELDVEQEHGSTECLKGVLDQDMDSTGLHQGDGADGDDYVTEKPSSLDQQNNTLSDQKTGSRVGVDDLTCVKTDQTDALSQPVEESARQETASECGGSKQLDDSCHPAELASEPGFQRSNSREAEVQACLGPDTLGDFSAVADIDPSHEGAIRNAESDKLVNLKVSRKMTDEMASSSDHVEDNAVTIAPHKSDVVVEPTAHLSFLKSLLQKSIHLKWASTDSSRQTKATEVCVELDKHLDTEVRDQPVVKTEEPDGAVEARIVTASPPNTRCEMPMKTEPSVDDADSMKSKEEERISEEGAQTCENSTSETATMQKKVATSDSATDHSGEVMCTEDGDVATSLTSQDQSPSATVTEAAPTSEPLHISEGNTDPSAVRLPCIHLPRFHLTAVQPYCMFHEVYNCEEYYPGGSCYMIPTRTRILQLRRNLAVRSGGRLPPLPARHQHTARTFGRVRRKEVRPRHLADSCVAMLPVPDGTPLPPTRAPPAPRSLPLPENVNISQVCEVVLLTPARSGDGSSCHGVRLLNGDLVRVGPGSMRAGVPWHMQPADNVVVTAADGRRFRNPTDRGCAVSLDVEGSVSELVHLPLAEVNSSLAQGRLALTNGFDGGVTLTPARVRVMCRDRLRRVAVGQKGRREVFGTGSVVVLDNAGQLTVIGALPPEVMPESSAESVSKKESASQRMKDGSGDISKSSVTVTPSTADDEDELQVIGTVQGSSTMKRQTTSGPKRAADGDANTASKKRPRVPAEQLEQLTSKGVSKVAQRKALLALSQPRSSDGKFLSMAKRIVKPPGSSNTTTEVTKKASAEGKKVESAPAKRAENIHTAVSPAGEEQPAPLTPAWVMNRLHSVSVDVLQADDEPSVAGRSLESTMTKVATGARTQQKHQPASSAAKRSKTLSATGVLMSVVQKIAKNSTKPGKGSGSARKEAPVKTTSLQGATLNSVVRQPPKLTQPVQSLDTGGESFRKQRLAIKSFAPSAPSITKSAPKSDDDVSRQRSFQKRSFVAESTVVATVPSTDSNGAKSRADRPGQSPRRKRQADSQALNGAALRVCDPIRPKVRRKSWADMPTSRRSWSDKTDATGNAMETVPRRRSWDNPAARQSWMDPQDDRPRVRRKSENPQDGARRRMATCQTALCPRTGEPQPTRPGSADQTRPPAERLSPTNGSRPPPPLLRCDGLPAQGRSGCGGAEPAIPQPALVCLTTPEKVPPSAETESAPTPSPSTQRRPKLPLEVTLLNESDMSDDGLDDLDELDAAVPADETSKDIYCPNIELIEL